MTNVVTAFLVAVTLMSAVLGAEQVAGQPGGQRPVPQPPTPPPAGQVPAVPAPPEPAVAVPGVTDAGSAQTATAKPLVPTCPAPVPPAVAPSRAFTGTSGMVLHQVIPTRVAEFENFLAYVREALAKTTNPTVRQQAKGWTFYRAVEAGPNNDALYVFLFEPAVPCADYAMSTMLAEVFTDTVQLAEIWRLYTGSVRSGGTLLNLTRMPVVPPKAVLLPAVPTAPGATPQPAGPSTTAPLPGADTRTPAVPPTSTPVPGAGTRK